MKSSVLYVPVLVTALSLFACPLAARQWTPAPDSDSCSAAHFHVNDLVSYAESRDERLANSSTNHINPGANGSIKVHGWANSDVLVRACIQAAAPSDAEARSIASQVTIARGAGMIEPSGPSTGDRLYWGVSYEVWVPNAANLDMEANNGSIAVAGVAGQIRFHTQNGSVHLTEVAGDVDGSTVNGSLTIDLVGSGWKGNGLRAETTNGSVRLSIPQNFSAQVQASTVNGRLNVDFPVTVSGEIGKTMSFQLGSGGALVEAKTVNGSVTIARKG
jgi:Putative adhesin